MSPKDIPPLHLVTDDAVLRRPDFLPVAAELLEAGGRSVALHVRGPGSTGLEVYDTARRLAPRAREVGGRLLVNDRVDVALALGLHGVHLPQRSLPPALARDILHRGGVDDHVLVGVSTHSDDELARATEAGADYAFVGAIFDTRSHPGRPGRGVQALSAAVATGLALVAIGGITPTRVGEVLAAGASGVAVIGGVWHAPHPRNALIQYLDALKRETGES